MDEAPETAPTPTPTPTPVPSRRRELSWEEANQRYLTAALAVLRARLEARAAPAGEEAAGDSALEAARRELEGAAAEMPAPPALDVLASAFGLSPFERDVLLLAAGPELDSAFAAALARAGAGSGSGVPTFSLPLAALPDAHWSALTPGAPLRHWRLIDLGGDAPAGRALTAAPLRVDERILHFLAGVQQLDERLVGRLDRLAVSGELLPSQQELAVWLAELWRRGAETGTLPALELTGPPGAGKREILAAAADRLGLELWEIAALAVPTDPLELDGFLRLWRRELVLAGRVLLVGEDDAPADEPARDAAVARLIDRLEGPVAVVSRSGRRSGRRPLVSFNVSPPGAEERAELWRRALGPAAAVLDKTALEEARPQDGQDRCLAAIAAQFQLGARAVRAASAEALATVAATEPAANRESGDPAARLGQALWRSGRRQARPLLGSLARQVEPRAVWDDLVLPVRQRTLLSEIAIHVRHRRQVYESWGFGARSSRGQGLAALFAGTSGTGKTMAAEVLAGELDLDLYHIDLATVISKYIGETEKNLGRLFDAAETGGAILLFDEADALFGKRSEVKDSHDRYANLEVSYLLQRMEAYRGLAILTSNRKNALDDAFLRRLRFVIEFPFPDPAAREAIWRGIFPPETPTADLDCSQLARLNVAGGNIKNIAIAAAFLAAGDGEPVAMHHLLRAAKGEYAKLEKPLPAAETRGWE
jgi:hypothetical protein